MTDRYHRMRTVITHEWVVPTDPPYGACWVEVKAALREASTKWLERNKAQAMLTAQDDRCLTVPDDAIRVKVGDDEIIVSFEETVER